MAKHIEATNISEAWVMAMEYLLTRGGKAPNLLISISPDGIDKEIPEVRRRFDVFLQKHENKRVRRIRKVADTIFPKVYYVRGPGKDARNHLYRMQKLGSSMEKRFAKRGTYFDRLIHWPGGKGTESEADRNQLERVIKNMRSRYDSGTRNQNAYELAISAAVPTETADQEESCIDGGDLRIQDPLLDPYRAVMGFPCLSHISLTLFNGRLDMTALYRNQHFITKAYGNLVGLSDLLRFIADEVGCDVGELVCIATHADAEIGKNGIRKLDIESLVRTCSKALEAEQETSESGE